MIYKRKCSNPNNNPKCKNDIIYINKLSYIRSIKNNKLCKSCSQVGIQSGKNNPMFGKHHSKETRKKMIKNHINVSGKNNPIYGKTGEKSPMFDKHHTKETKRKMRISRIKLIQKNKLNGNQLAPNYNPDACRIIDEYGKKNGYSFQHAMNGGEFLVKGLGYFTDGYDRNKNVVIEYYESHHFNRNGKLRLKDIIRKQEIIKQLDCKFIELYENNMG